MICKKCKKKINAGNCLYAQKRNYAELILLKELGEKVPNILLDTYKDCHAVPLCESCNYPIDYVNMPMEMFFEWLKHSSEKGDSRETSGKALIRYFELDKLLELKKEVGD